MSGTPTENVLKCDRNPAHVNAAPLAIRIQPRRGVTCAHNSNASPMPNIDWPNELVRFDVQIV